MYLWILVLKMAALNIKRLTSCLWSTVEKFIDPLDASKGVQMAAMWAASKIALASDDCIQFSGGPEGALIVVRLSGMFSSSYQHMMSQCAHFQG
jgi:hypothetical protein